MSQVVKGLSNDSLLTPLTGLSTANATAVLATDSLLVAIGKLQAQINAGVTAPPGFTGAIELDADSVLLDADYVLLV